MTAMTAPHRRRTRRDERTGADPDVVREIFDAARLSREPDPRTPPGP
ncbi:MAG: hypothetical protein GWM91_12965, partial [Actinobacteria bacterium]|nr:hypothetical protein [Actinomycetota bacterium]NIX51267.1 hypothetical protein [Actinomycetota bacterium]